MKKKTPRPMQAPIRERDRRRAEFAATVSHDLKTPLNAIVGFLSVLMQDAPRMQPEWVEYLAQINRSAHRLLERINDLLELYRLEAGKISFAPAWMSARETLAQAAGPARSALERNGGRLDTEAPRVRIFCDERLISRVIRELCANAAQAARDGAVRVSLVVDGAGPRERRLRLDVEDSGPGLGRERLALLEHTLSLDPSSDAAAWDGLGLGLALARQAAFMLGGRLTIEPRAEGGTRARLEFALPAEHVEDASGA